MNDTMKDIILPLLSMVHEGYASCKEDRRQLHKLEWSQPEDFPTVLGEAEVRADAIIGIASKVIRVGLKDNDESLKILERYGIYASPALRDWLLADGERFGRFAAYLHSLEHLRGTLMDCLKG